MSAATAIGTSIHLKYLRFHVVILSNFFCARTWFPFFMILQLDITGDFMFLLWKSFKGRCDSHESHLPLFRTIYFPIAPYKPPPAAACFLSISFHTGKYTFLPGRQNGWPLPAPTNTADEQESRRWPSISSPKDSFENSLLYNTRSFSRLPQRHTWALQKEHLLFHPDVLCDAPKSHPPAQKDRKFPLDELETHELPEDFWFFSDC